VSLIRKLKKAIPDGEEFKYYDIFIKRKMQWIEFNGKMKLYIIIVFKNYIEAIETAPY
jgi:hypothetical protein